MSDINIIITIYTYISLPQTYIKFKYTNYKKLFVHFPAFFSILLFSKNLILLIY